MTLRALRYYLKTEPEENLIKEIQDMLNARQLRALWEAGLSSRLQEQVLFQLEQIE